MISHPTAAELAEAIAAFEAETAIPGDGPTDLPVACDRQRPRHPGARG